MVFEKRPIIAAITGCMRPADVYSAGGGAACTFSPESLKPPRTLPIAGLCDPATSLPPLVQPPCAGVRPPGNLAGRLLRTAAVHRVQAGGAGRLPNRRTLYPASGRLHTKNSCRPGPGSATRPRCVHGFGGCSGKIISPQTKWPKL